MLIPALLFFISLSNAQGINQENTSGKSPFLIGKINKVGLTSKNYNDWFSKNFTNSNPDSSVLKDLSKTLSHYDITLFMGTWCGDSKRQVPKFYKVLEDSGYPMEQLTAVAVSREPGMYKQSPQHEEKGLNIHRVPTFIFYKNGKEVGRIVEKPVESLEKDILKIISSKQYRSNYQIVTEIDDILKNKGVKGLKRKENKLLKAHEETVTSMFELNTYGRILHLNKRTKEAIAVFEFNTKLFPDQPRAYMSLANTLGGSGDKDRAIEVLEKAMKIHPDNTALIKNLEVIKSN